MSSEVLNYMSMLSISSWNTARRPMFSLAVLARTNVKIAQGLETKSNFEREACTQYKTTLCIYPYRPGVLSMNRRIR
jgi:hypothetical protein